jgi:hypothetical protein
MLLVFSFVLRGNGMFSLSSSQRASPVLLFILLVWFISDMCACGFGAKRVRDGTECNFFLAGKKKEKHQKTKTRERETEERRGKFVSVRAV